MLAGFALFDDKSYYFSPGGSVVAFVAKGRVALALGDPPGYERNEITVALMRWRQDAENGTMEFLLFRSSNGPSPRVMPPLTAIGDKQ